MNLTLPKLHTSKKKGVLSWNPIHAHRDWRRIIQVVCLAALLVIAWSTYLFYDYQNEQSVGAVTEALDLTTTRNTESLSALYKQRAEQRSASSTDIFVDPSR